MIQQFITNFVVEMLHSSAATLQEEKSSQHRINGEAVINCPHAILQYSKLNLDV